MANYAVTDWASTVTTLEAALAEAEVYLETIDSTTNAVINSGVVQLGSAGFQAWIIHNA